MKGGDYIDKQNIGQPLARYKLGSTLYDNPPVWECPKGFSPQWRTLIIPEYPPDRPDCILADTSSTDLPGL